MNQESLQQFSTGEGKTPSPQNLIPPQPALKVPRHLQMMRAPLRELLDGVVMVDNSAISTAIKVGWRCESESGS